VLLLLYLHLGLRSLLESIGAVSSSPELSLVLDEFWWQFWILTTGEGDQGY
jgi:hypothetical protein